MVRLCKKCGKTFNPTSNNQKYCSIQCKNNNQPVTVCKYCNKVFKNPYGHKTYCSNDCRAKSKRTAHYYKFSNCKYCGKIIEDNTTHKLYCSDICKYKANGTWAKCSVCGKEFHKKDLNNQYCSRECQWQSLKNINYSVCKTCGKTFVVGRNCKGDYCSNECQWKSLRTNPRCKDCGKAFKGSGDYCSKCGTLRCRLWINGYDKACDSQIEWMLNLSKQMAKENERMKVCIECGKTFKGRTIRTSFCSRACINRFNNRRKEERIYRNGKPDLTINLYKVYDKFNGVCVGCGKVLNFEVDSNSDDYPSIDHILPLSKGGLHRWDNVQLMCRKCNMFKGNSIID